MLTVGETRIELPVPADVPPQLPENQFQLEFRPKVPPVSVSVEDEPAITVAGDAVAEVAPVEFTITIALTHVVVLHGPCALK